MYFKWLWTGQQCRPGSGTLLRSLCQSSLLNISPSYAAILGTLGVCLNIYEICMIIQNGSRLANAAKCKRALKAAFISPEIQRDLKLVSLVLSLEYYLLLIIGAIGRNSAYFVPWMIFYSIVISMEFLLFVMRLVQNGPNIEKNSLILSIFIVYNWLAIFCAFLHIRGGCSCNVK